jgi:hypothetical protein
MAMQFVDQKHQVLRSAIISRWCEISCGLVSPGTEKGMVHDGKKLHMGETQSLKIRG